jgi:hypothetical protein
MPVDMVNERAGIQSDQRVTTQKRGECGLFDYQLFRSSSR